MRKFNIKSLIVGIMIGATLMFGTQSLAAVGDSVTAVFANFNLVINGQTRTMDTVPLVYNGTSYLPVRDIANLFGYDVTYKADSRTIVLNSVYGSVYAPTPVVAAPTVTPAPTPPTPRVAIAPVSNSGSSQIYYSFGELYQKYNLLSGVRNGKTFITHKNSDYTSADETNNYYYDLSTDNSYYSENFLLQFLTKGDLLVLSKFSIDRNNKTVTKI